MKNQRWVLLSFTIGAILMGLVVQSATVSAMAQFAYPDARVLSLINTSSLMALVSGVACFFLLIRNRKVIRFTDEVVTELKQVTWPTRDETVRASTTVVLSRPCATGDAPASRSAVTTPRGATAR